MLQMNTTFCILNTSGLHLNLLNKFEAKPFSVELHNCLQITLSNANGVRGGYFPQKKCVGSPQRKCVGFVFAIVMEFDAAIGELELDLACFL